MSPSCFPELGEEKTGVNSQREEEAGRGEKQGEEDKTPAGVDFIISGLVEWNFPVDVVFISE